MSTVLGGLLGPVGYRQLLDKIDEEKRRRFEEIEKKKAEDLRLERERQEKEYEEDVIRAAKRIMNLLQGENSAALIILRMMKEEVVLFERPKIKIVISGEKGIDMSGTSAQLRLYDVPVGDRDVLEVMAVKAAIHRPGGFFSGHSTDSLVGALEQVFDRIALKLREKIQNKDFDGLIEGNPGTEED